MEVITGPRQNGKTTEAIKLSNDKDAHLVVRTAERRATIEASSHYPEVENNIYSMHEIKNDTARGVRPNRFVIDDISFVLSLLVGGEVCGITATGNSTDLGEKEQ